MKNPTPYQVKGVKQTEPCLEDCDVDETLPCNLHLQIGAINDACAYALLSVQAACEKWDDEFTEMQGYVAWLERDHKETK